VGQRFADFTLMTSARSGLFKLASRGGAGLQKMCSVYKLLNPEANMSALDPSPRRPLASRSTGWARWLSRSLLQIGLKPNQVSILSVVFALAAGFCVFQTGQGVGNAWQLWLGGAVGIQLRLLCNLMDGMLAIEGKLKSAHGDLYNEVPDRLADVAILAPLGYATGSGWGVMLGWLCAVGAVFTAYVRVHGASLVHIHDFRGPMAKPHRMALATGLCVLLILHSVIGRGVAEVRWIVSGALGLMLLGITITSTRRLRRIAQLLSEKAAKAAQSHPSTAS
jgi:phosphatidylglycerophosphate synthase